jgi:NADH-quinone oxidoreductase subunit M
MQKDFKRLIAYSSFSHVNFILVGLFIWNQMAHSGAILQALNHGITIAGLFLVAGWLEERLGSTIIGNVSGMAKFLPQLCWLTLFFVLSSVALPGLNNFVGELMIFLGLFTQNPWLTAFLGLIVILSIVYMLHWMQEIYFGAPNFFQITWVDIKAKEIAFAMPLVILILWIGMVPTPILRQIESATKHISTLEDLKQ